MRGQRQGRRAGPAPANGQMEEGKEMPQKPKYYIVEASALPEVYLKVAEVKRLLETGQR